MAIVCPMSDSRSKVQIEYGIWTTSMSRLPLGEKAQAQMEVYGHASKGRKRKPTSLSSISTTTSPSSSSTRDNTIKKRSIRSWSPRVQSHLGEISSIKDMQYRRPQVVIVKSDVSNQSHRRRTSIKGEKIEFDRPTHISLSERMITYTLHLTFENALVHDETRVRQIQLTDFNSYQKIEEIAENHVKYEHAWFLASKDLVLRHGKCTIIGDGDCKDTQSLTSLDDWKDIRTVLINLWTSDYHRTLHLEIYREYYGLQTKVTGTVNFAATKRKEIHSLMQRATWDNKTYIPRTDLLRVTSKDHVRQIIVEDPLTFTDIDEREAFVQFVQRKASLLLAMCIYANLSMGCLRMLLDNGLEDSKLPLQDCDCCHSDCEIEFHGLVERQGAFVAAGFWNIGEHLTFDAHTIIPMSFHPKLPDAEDLMLEEQENDSDKEESRHSEDNSAKKKAYCGSGAYSNVYRVKIDPNHHRLSKVSVDRLIYQTRAKFSVE